MKRAVRSTKSFVKQHHTLVVRGGFILGFIVIGTVLLLTTKAATFVASLEPEQGTATGNACTVGSDSTASQNSYVKFSSTACSGGSLPAGVTLQDIDGGQTYFEQWKYSFPSARLNPGYFPIAVFNTFGLGAPSPSGGGVTKGQAYKNLGINTFVNLYNGAFAGTPPDVSVVKSLGMKAVIGSGDSVSSLNSGGYTDGSAGGYVYQDEAEGNPCSKINDDYLRTFCVDDGNKVATSSFITMTNKQHALDPDRPVYQGFTNGYVFGWFLNGTASDLAASSDIIGYDVYPMTDRRSTYGGGLSAGHVYGLYDTVVAARSHANPSKPIWPDIEVSETGDYDTTCYRPTPADTKAEIWGGIIGGARGYTFFDATAVPSPWAACPSVQPSGDVLTDTAKYQTMISALPGINSEVTALAPVINSKTALGYVTNNAGLSTSSDGVSGVPKVMMITKYYNNTFYIFTAPHTNTAQNNVVFTLPAGTTGTVTVLNENRTIPITNHSFTDSYAGETTVHLYKIN